jgi:hypothetical protein
MSQNDDPRNEEFAGWFQPLSRREVGQGSLAFAAVAALAGVSSAGAAGCGEKEVPAELDSLQLQKEHGWNVGAESSIVILYDRASSDSQKGFNYIRYRSSPTLLNLAFQPRPLALRPYAVNTLAQSLGQSSLSVLMAPVYNARMQMAYDKGATMGHDILLATDNAQKTALIVDLPGPEAVAFGAGIADQAHLVPTFDNWPHPLGVVQSHQTLGAMLYYAAEIEQKKAQVPDGGPVAFLLDANRLAAYGDASDRFDNRYPAKIPEVSQLKAMGITNVMYVTSSRAVAREQDDLNDAFVAYKGQGVDVAVMPLDAFTPGTGNPPPGAQVRYYYGGQPSTHYYFFTHYPFYAYRPALIINTSVAYRGPLVAPVFVRPIYAPVIRPTVFSGLRVGGVAGIGRVRPAGFGRTSVRVAGGRVAAVRVGRTGSFTRGGSFYRG